MTHRARCATGSSASFAACSRCRDLRRRCAPPRQYLQLRAARHRGGDGADGARSRWRDGQLRCGLFVGQGEAVACAESDGRFRRSRAFRAARELRLEFDRSRCRCGHRVARETDRSACARGRPHNGCASKHAKRSPRSARSTNTASSPTSRWSARRRASMRTRSAISRPRRTSRNGCWNGGSARSAAGWRCASRPGRACIIRRSTIRTPITTPRPRIRR